MTIPIPHAAWESHVRIEQRADGIYAAIVTLGIGAWANAGIMEEDTAETIAAILIDPHRR